MGVRVRMANTAILASFIDVVPIYFWKEDPEGIMIELPPTPLPAPTGSATATCIKIVMNKVTIQYFIAFWFVVTM